MVIGGSIVVLLASVIALASMAGHDAATTAAVAGAGGTADDAVAIRGRAERHADRYRPRHQPRTRRLRLDTRRPKADT